MTHIEKSVRIEAPKTRVWEILADFGGVSKFHPGLRGSHSTSAANQGVGATRHCDLAPMGSVEERIVEWREGSEYWVEIYQGEKLPPLRSAVARLKVREEGSETVVGMVFDYQLKLGPVGAVMNQLMVRREFEKAVSDILNGLKVYTETGRRATRERIRELRLAGAVA